MARRSAPPNSGPAYYTPAQLQPSRASVDPNEGFFGWLMREQILAPEKLPGNISIVTGVSVFLGGVFIMRKWGDLLVPA
ncbi:uncharacterized protein STEHIDRAFT_88502 [Stereum hirsutum FP-91666 SS1]|uniref:uncharacterized protein n=1 Tax=Stereum hirsutum (strain FP-91666) TaxID=721885 RepID=UPI000440E3FE|nr:uncharacterized protein STEHIDRAFT_88502 [Stereum hirsutum FP-91666 SS1]EIM91837.1 hypothetical protein STEHIDRAFT_88502 [Stereum hirsutum FP-91666 SS1]